MKDYGKEVIFRLKFPNGSVWQTPDIVSHADNILKYAGKDCEYMVVGTEVQRVDSMSHGRTIVETKILVNPNYIGGST